MKSALKLSAVILTFALIITAFAACAGSADSGIVGTWEAEIDVSEVMAKTLEGSGIDASGSGEIALNIEVTFANDGTYKLNILDVEGFIERMKEYIKPSITALFESMASASGMDLDTFITASGYESIDGLIEEAANNINPEEMVDDIKGGKYETDGNKLFMYEDTKNENEYVVYNLDGGKLTFESVTGADDGDSILSVSEIFPIVFEAK